MNVFFDPKTPTIQLLSLEHAFYFFTILTLVVLTLLNAKTLKHHAKTLRIILLSLSIFQQTLLYTWYLFMTNFDLSQALPLHLCRISSLLGIIYLINLNPTLMDYVFYYGLFAYGSFLLPIAIHPPYHALGISYIINHSLTLLLPFIAWHAWSWRPNKKNLLPVTLFFLLYFFASVFANELFNGNYFYLTQRPFLKNLEPLSFNVFAIFTTVIGFHLAYLFLSKLNKQKNN